MKYLKTFEGYRINLDDVTFGEKDAVGHYKIPSYGKVIYCLYKGMEIANIKYYVFTETPYTKEFRGYCETEIYIDYIETDEDYQRNGIAKILINKLIEKAKELRIDVITLKYDMFSKDPEWLKGYYEKLGFKILNGNKMYFPLVSGIVPTEHAYFLKK